MEVASGRVGREKHVVGVRELEMPDVRQKHETRTRVGRDQEQPARAYTYLMHRPSLGYWLTRSKMTSTFPVLLMLVALGVPRGIASDSAPRITIQPNDLIAIEGETTELNCDAEGQPKPTIDWYHNGRLIRTTHLRTIMGGSIQFLDVRPDWKSSQQQAASDAGTYYCLARNSLGSAQSRNASLQVACK